MSFNISSENMNHYNPNASSTNTFVDTPEPSTNNIDIMMNPSNKSNNNNATDFVSSYDGSFNNVSSPSANPPISFRRSSMTSEDYDSRLQNSMSNNNIMNNHFANNNPQLIKGNFNQYDSFNANSIDSPGSLPSNARLVNRNIISPNNNNNMNNVNSANYFSSYKNVNPNSFNNPLLRASYNAPSIVSSSYSSSINSPIQTNNNKFISSSVGGHTSNQNGFVDVSHHSLSFKPRLSSSFASAKVTITNANSTTTSALNINNDNLNSSKSLQEQEQQEQNSSIQQHPQISSDLDMTNDYDNAAQKINTEPYSIAREIYSGRLRTVNGISIDDKNEEHLNIVEYPTEELLKMLASLLEKIVDANDVLRPENKNENDPGNSSNNDGTSNLMDEDQEKFVANVLAFHGKNVPGIPIYSYFLRILKYCPLANDIFLSLLVYFDRIAKRTNNKEITSPSNDGNNPTTGNKGQQLFVMDSYNIHRLIIAGITVSSKVLSDIFYKNSRYARVGGLPLEELNHIELQFILLTDLKLLIQPDELQRYADLLLKFWRREEAKQQQQQQPLDSEMS